MNSIDKLAKKDAFDWARAEMFFGEGAGTRRKLLEAQIAQRVERMNGYHEAFTKAYEQQDMVKHAEKALQERKKIDRAVKTSKNLRAIKSGNLNNLSTGVFVVVGAVYIAHQTGYDKKIEAEAKKLYKRAKTEIKFRKARMQGRNVERIF